FGNSQYAHVALNLLAQPKAIPLMQATHLIVSPQLAPQLKQPVNFGLPKDGIKIGETNGQVNNGQKVNGGLGINLPGKGDNNGGPNNTPGTKGAKIVTVPINQGGKGAGAPEKKSVTLPAPGGNPGPANGNTGIDGGKIVTLPVNNGGKTGSGQDTKVD